MFEIKSIQADNGDSLLVTYSGHEPPRHILIDGGTSETLANLLEVLSQHRVQDRLRLEVLVITHYDLDHIQGILGLLRQPPEWLDIGDVWFNGRHQIVASDTLGHGEGTELSKIIAAKYSWNRAFGGTSIRISRTDVQLAGGLLVKVLSPNESTLYELAAEWPANGEPPIDNPSEWEATPDLLGRDDTWPPGSFTELAKQRFSRDKSVPNGSSIALMLEFAGQRVLLAGDAFPSVIASAIKLHWPSQKPVVDVFKLSHHGSKRNTDDTLLSAIDCRRFLFSTNGKVHGHPDAALIARVLRHSTEPQLIFNYEQDRTSGWRQVPKGWPAYTTFYPEPNDAFVKITV